MIKGTELWNGNKEEFGNFLDWNNVVFWAIKKRWKGYRAKTLFLV
jgi:hypothetical protein